MSSVANPPPPTTQRGRGGRTAIPQLFPKMLLSSSEAALPLSEAASELFRSSSEVVPKSFRSRAEVVPKSFRSRSEVVPCYLRSRPVLPPPSFLRGLPPCAVAQTKRPCRRRHHLSTHTVRLWLRCVPPPRLRAFARGGLAARTPGRATPAQTCHNDGW